MDRKGKQKIRYILWMFVSLMVVIIIFFVGSHYKGKVREEQLQELLAIYPEVANGLQDNFDYYQKQAIHLELVIMAVILVWIIILVSGLIWSRELKKSNDETQMNQEIELIYEQLFRFQKGDFEIIDSLKDTDITDRWSEIHEKFCELGCYFSDMKVRLAEEENSTKMLITDISHQLKTPLTSIHMSHELAKSSDLSEEERKNFLETEFHEIKKMEVLLDELVKLSRLENNMIQIKPEKNSLKQTLSEAVSQIVMKAHAKQIKICVDMEGDVLIAHDRKWTVEAFANILENAVKYSEPNTMVRIRVSYLPSNILLEVEDEGIGIREEELHEIFKRFYRGSRAKEQIKEGAGVGLYLARNIIEQQGGTILAKRKPKNGTIFKIMLPL